MGRASYRDNIVAAGALVIHKRGFGSTGLREITAAAGVAQGSFTSHFASKDEFGIVVVDHYFVHLRGVMAQRLCDMSLPPIKRLRAYFDTITGFLEDAGWRYGCLAGNMALEASERSEPIRLRLSEIFSEWSPMFAEVIKQGQKSGDIRPELDAEEAGAALLEAWHGAMLRMKVDRTSAPLDRFKTLILPSLLLNSSSSDR